MASFKKYLDEDILRHFSYTLRFWHYYLKTISLHLFWLCFCRKQKSDPTMGTASAFPSTPAHKSSGLTFQMRGPGHVARSVRWLAAAHLGPLTLRPRPTHAHPHVRPHARLLRQTRRLLLPLLHSSAWPTFLKRNLALHSESPPTPSPPHWGPSSRDTAAGRAGSVQNDFLPLSAARVPRALRPPHCALNGLSLAGRSA